MMKKNIFLAAICLLMHIPAQAIFYNCIVLRNNKTGQRIFALSDYRGDALIKKKKTGTQRADLISVLQDLKADGELVHCIVADLAHQRDVDAALNKHQDCIPFMLRVLQICLKGSFDNLGIAGSALVEKVFDYHQREILKDYHSPLGLLEKHLHALGISCLNVDVRDIVYDAVYNNSDEKITDGLDHLNEKERKGVDGLSRIIIGKTVSSIKNNEIKNRLLDFMYSHYAVSDTMGLFDRSKCMVDVAAIDDLYQNKNIRNVFLCAGGSHVRNIVTFLKSTGDYQQVNFVGCDNEDVIFKFKLANFIPLLKDGIDAIPSNMRAAQMIKTRLSKVVNAIFKDDLVDKIAIHLPKAIVDGLKAERNYLKREENALQLPAYCGILDAVKARAQSKL
ncbi:MAG TPA: hypothetical protein VGT41_03595 [Candidatus Babeliales bacterium]|nr:hypothetical protein [Candidatus Babeliales bacterium]